MKYALFEFVNEKSCEVGETRWIMREDPDNFGNDGWDWEKEVIVAWPREFSKVHKKIIKSSIDPSSLATTACVAKVLKFSDDYETIRLHMIRYCETGSLKTPNHGRGKRALIPNGRYANSDNEEPRQQVTLEKSSKRPKKSNGRLPETCSSNEMEALRAKYKLSKKKTIQESQELSEYEEDNDISCQFEDGEVVHLKKENHNLQKKLQEKEKEIEHLKLVISNLKVMPCLTDVVVDLQEQVRLLKNGQYSLTGQETPSRPSSRTSTPSRPSSRSSTPGPSSDSDVESEMVSLCPNIVLTKGQYVAIKSKSNLKDFMYSIMGMLWTREVLCTHSITGKASNAFKEKDVKPQLDSVKVKSICEYGAKRFGCKVTEVRQMMTTRINNIVKVEKAKQKASVEQ